MLFLLVYIAVFAAWWIATADRTRSRRNRPRYRRAPSHVRIIHDERVGE